MKGIMGRLFTRQLRLAEATPADACALAALHAASFHRGWSENEFERLLSDRNVLAHRATAGENLDGFILSRLVFGEAEIFLISVASTRPGRGLGRRTPRDPSAPARRARRALHFSRGRRGQCLGASTLSPCGFSRNRAEKFVL